MNPQAPLFLLSLGFLAIASAPAARLQLRGEAPVEVGVESFKDGVLVLSDGRRIERDRVVAIDLGSGGATGAVAAASASVVATEPRMAGWEAAAAELESAYPGHPALLVEDEGHEILRPDGSRVRKSRLLFKIRKESAIGYGSWRVSFDPARERVKLNRARTLRPDGTALELDPSAVTIQDAPSSASRLTNRKVATWRLDAVGTGAWVEHDYEVEEFNPFKPEFFFPDFFFQSDVPTGLCRFAVTVPKEKTLFTVTRNLAPEDVETTIVEEGETRTHTWIRRKVEPMVPEASMPGEGDLTPQVRGSLFADWQPFFAWESESLERHIVPTPEIELKAREITQGTTGSEAQVAALYRYLQREIRYVSVKSGIGSGWSGHPAHETLKNGYGDCVDKSVLFCSMLRVLGIKGVPLALMTNDAHDMETRLPGFDANHCITQVDLGGRTVILDSTSSSYRYPYWRSDSHGQPATNALDGKVLTLPIPPPEENLSRRRFEVRLDAEGGLDFSEKWDGNGTVEADERSFWKSKRKEDLETVFRQYYSSVAPGARVVAYQIGNADDLADPMTYSAAFRADGYAARAGSLLIVKIPLLELSFPETALPTRRFPIDYRTTSQREEHWRIELPKGWRVKAAPKPVKKRSDHVAFELGVVEKDGVLQLDRVLRIEKTMVGVAEYPKHRAFLKELERLGQEHLFLEIAPGGGP